jgi:hypothetical protein
VKGDTSAMFYELNEEQNSFRRRVREIYEREVSPLVEKYAWAIVVDLGTEEELKDRIAEWILG